jgi:hypothetical protein
MKFLTRKGFLIEEQGVSYLTDTDRDRGLGSLQAAACTYRIALGPRAGHKVLSLQTVRHESRLRPCVVSTSRASACMPRSAAPPIRGRNSKARHRDVACLARRGPNTVPLHHPSRHRQRTPDSKPAGQVVLTLKTPYRDGTIHIVMSPLEFMQRLAALIPRPRLHLIRFHGVLAPNARLRPEIIPTVPVNAHTPSADPAEAPLPQRLPA